MEHLKSYKNICSMSRIEISNDMTTIIKGFAIIFMIGHHVLIKEFYINPPDFLYSFVALRLYIGMKMCVGIYTFFIGYAYFYSKRRTSLTSIFSRIRKLLQKYWIVLLVTISIAFVGGYHIECKDVLFNIVGLKHQYNLANWYIYFYIYALFILPLFPFLFKRNKWLVLVSAIIICGLGYNLIKGNNSLLIALKECLCYTPLLMIGYMCASTQILSYCSTFITKRHYWIMIVFFSLILRCGFPFICGIVSDIIFVPIFVMSISALFNEHKQTPLAKVLTNLGLCSTMMWFIHAIPFSTAVRDIFQTSPIWINNSIFLFIFVTIISYALALMYNKAVSYMKSKSINKII